MTQSTLEFKLNGLDMTKSFALNSDMLSFAQWLFKTHGDLDIIVKQWLTINIGGFNQQGDKFRHDFCKLSDLI